MRYRNKQDWIIPFVKDKKVLDLGCVQHNLAKTEKSGWLHGVICKHAESALGVDYMEYQVAVLKKQGYDVVCANVETMELGDKFEVIVAGDIIEHLSNCGKFMERVYEHLAPGGLFLLSTPNPVHFLRFVQLLARGRVGANLEHTCWFPPQVLNQLAGRYGFEIVDVAYVNDSHQHYDGFKWVPFLMLNDVLCLVRPQFCETLSCTRKECH
jgi:SAM-dependent methyltransferase